ncbi:SDR family NAD(P)-dependent oxidoreductase [Pseudomonas sp. N040]|uniref:SDR family NAD(P)-dependent oxidoreductase n=1 Tax=Pseudomonas sp. N040 TaxID=2785325 RepID=UPI0018A26916|nr:SDR family NAD(P)-dependent oxidoreductase [Pseudomonas sp. N040]MBF7729045.1 SDR family NAD(P)-dependent oxidoreductase [Pseudomonas sp. N040]MBW7012685.1 SDR family NAD(P)-dependent oxidoreductase [Pseudomonas sp. N040]
MQSFNYKVAAITGAGSGIGRALAYALARRGCDLALSDINDAGLAETASQARKLGVKASETLVDVSDRAAMHAWADKVVAEHGKVNLIFNNAGVAHCGTVAATQYSDYEWLLGINLWGVIHGTKAFLPYLQASGEGHVINISSVFGLFAQPTQSVYNTSKFAVRGFTESLRQELDLSDCGVSASCVHPGGIKTNIAQAARFTDSGGEMLGKNSDLSRQAFNDNMLRTSPDKAAEIILRGVERNRRRIIVGLDARLADWIQRILPAAYQRLVVTLTRWSR